MNRFDYEIRITPSVLDRLIDEEPGVSREAPASRQKSLRQLKQAVRRDLEWLLNTRQLVGGVPPELKEVSQSLAAYGLPDFTAVSLRSPADQNRVRRTIEAAISTFEPRLEDVIVTLTPPRETEHILRFRVDARLKVEPAPEPVTFDTVLQLGSGQYIVQGE
jgi:type VI secretion system protein ImpF